MNKTLALLTLMLALVACAPEQQKPFTVGIVAPLSGGNAWIGEFVINSLELAKEELNAEGGINGKPILFILEDADNAAKATTAAQKIIGQDNVNILYSVTTPVTAGASTVAEQSSVPLFGFTSVSTYAKKNTWVFSDLRDVVQECKLLGEAALTNGHAKIAFLGNDADFSVECVDTLKTTFVLNGGQIIANEMKPANDPDARTAVTKLKEANPDAIVLFCWPPDCNLIFKQMLELDFVPPFYLPVGLASGANPAAVKDLDKDKLWKTAYAGEQWLNPDQPTPAFSEFRTKAENRMKKSLLGPVDAAIAYDDLYEIALAARNCPEFTNECLRNQLSQTDYTGAAGHIAFNGKHYAARPARVIQYKGGKWAPYP
ncbi:MAG TPA: ABC transporter substrate-binding protein [Candidatus Nanoarchaeia archaeon]|nr:ABC transporter substrate-binding protein [Candidatus Nanoarchaeia archaeon]